MKPLLICKECLSAAKDTSKYRGRFLRRHPTQCRAYQKRIAVVRPLKDLEENVTFKKKELIQ